MSLLTSGIVGAQCPNPTVTSAKGVSVKNLLSIALASLLLACGGGGADVVIHAVPSKADAVWNVSYGQVKTIMDTCFPDASSVVVTDVHADGAHLFVGGTLQAAPPYHQGGVDVGDPLTVYNNLPNCPQPATTSAP